MSSPYGEDIAVLKDQMKDVKVALDRIEGKLDASNATYATKQELKTFKWLTLPITVILTVVITALVYYYLSHGRSISPETTADNPSTSTVSGSAGTPSATANSTAHSDTATPSDSQTSTSLGGTVDNTLKQTGL